MARHDYDWVDDPFNDQKNEQLKQNAQRNVLVSGGCFVVVAIAAVAIMIFLLAGAAASTIQ